MADRIVTALGAGLANAEQPHRSLCALIVDFGPSSRACACYVNHLAAMAASMRYTP